jgi:hypothetical protein
VDVANQHQVRFARPNPFEQPAREAFRLLEWVEGQASLAPVLKRVRRRATASVQRVNARYLLDDGQSSEALRAWMRALAIHPTTALARLNLLGSALLNLTGLGALRRAILRSRQKRLTG